MEICTDCTWSKKIFFCCNCHISSTMRTSNWKWNLDHAIIPLTLKRWITIASTIWCTLYISFLLKKILFTVLLKLKLLSLETKWVINITTFVFSCLQVIDISNMLKKIENTGICIIHGSIPEVCRSSIKTKNPHNL